jgi:hypothetical protein
MGVQTRIAIVVPGDDDESIIAAAEAAIAWNRWWLRRNPFAPLLHASGVRYQRESKVWRDRGEDRFVAIPYVMERGVGDCDDLVAWRTAELRERFGVPAVPLLVPQSPVLVHMVVQLPDGSIDDPSAALGMLDGLR